LAVKATIEAAVVELIKEGERKGVWDYKKAVVVVPKEVPKLEEKKDDKPISEVLPAKKEEPKIEEKKSEIKEIVIPEVKSEKKEPAALFGNGKFKSDEYLYSEQNLSSTKKWMFKKNSVVSIRELGTDGWVRVADSNFRSGWVRLDVLDKIQ
jgi:hypothetical protein